MTKYIITSLLLFVPFMSMAADHCTDPKKYTIDKRCYVTDEQTQQKPYNAVATLLLNNGRIYCSGTVVKRQSLLSKYRGYFLYTAQHCVDGDHDHVADDMIKIRLPSNQIFDAKLVKKGDFNYTDDTKENGDWAIYRLLTNEQNSKTNVKDILEGPYVKINSSFSGGNIRIIGYGALKIMSDQEIQDFKKEYKDFITDLNVNDEQTKDGGIRGNGLKMFLWHNYWRFEDNLLKVSKCSQNTNYQIIGCQGWNGNSGGGAFDDNGDLVWIATVGNYQIGGANHASIVSGIKFGSFNRLPDE